MYRIRFEFRFVEGGPGDVRINECKSEDGVTYIQVRLRKSEDEEDDPSCSDATRRSRNGVGTVLEMC